MLYAGPDLSGGNCPGSPCLRGPPDLKKITRWEISKMLEKIVIGDLGGPP